MDLQVTAHGTVRAVEEIAAEWQQLHDAAQDGNPFNGPDWPLTWLRHFGSERSRPLVLEVRGAGRLVGVAPLYRRTVMGGTLRMIAPIGVGQPWVMPYELPTLLAAPGTGRDVCREVVAHLCRHEASWDVARLMFGAAAGWLEPQWIPDYAHAVLVRRLRADVVLPLHADNDPYTGRRNLKESFRRARNRLTRDVGADGWSVTVQRTGEDVVTALRTLTALHRVRSDLGDGAPKHADALADPAVRAFLDDVLAHSSKRDGVSVYELRIGDEVVASQLVLHTAGGSYFSLSGMTSRAWPYSAVTYLQSIAVADARAAGQRLMHLSTGPNQAKMRWTDEIQYHPEHWLVGPGVRSRAAYLAEEVASVFTSLREARAAHVVRPGLRASLAGAVRPR